MFILIPPSLSSFNPTHSFCKYLLILINFYFSQLTPSTYIIHIYSFLLITLSQSLSLSLRDSPHRLHHTSPTHSLSYLTIITDHPHHHSFSPKSDEPSFILPIFFLPSSSPKLTGGVLVEQSSCSTIFR